MWFQKVFVDMGANEIALFQFGVIQMADFKLLFVFSYEGLDGLVVSEGLEAPRITDPNQVLVRVHAASIEPVDVSILSGLGRHERRPRGSCSDRQLVLGRDLSGVVVEVGLNVSTLAVGDQVWAIVPLTARYSTISTSIKNGHFFHLTATSRKESISTR